MVGGVNIFHALCPGHLQLASGCAVGLKGGTLKCLRFCHICRQDVDSRLVVRAGGRGGGQFGEGWGWRVSISASNVM